MTQGIGLGGNTPYVDHTKVSTAQPKQQVELESSAGAQEQRTRDQAATSGGLLQSPVQDVIKPDKATIRQLEANETQQALTNATGLGKTAVSSYQSLASAEFTEQMANKVKVDITA